MLKKSFNIQPLETAFILAAFGTLSFVLVGLLPHKVMADEAPAVDSVSVKDALNNDLTSTGLHPISGGTTDVTVSGLVSDVDGCSDIAYVQVFLVRSSAWQPMYETCSDDKNNCYSAWVSNLTGCDASSTTAGYSATFSTTNYIDPTDTGTYASDNWIAVVMPYDQSDRHSVDTSTVFEVYSLASFSVTSQIDYGTLPLDGISEFQDVTFTNNGNTVLDAYARADGPMVSDHPGFLDIPEGNVHYATAWGFDYASGTAMTTSDVFVPLQLPQQTTYDRVPPTADLFFQLHMPASGVKGPYRNILTFTALPVGGTGGGGSGTLSLAGSVDFGNFGTPTWQFGSSLSGTTAAVGFTATSGPMELALVNVANSASPTIHPSPINSDYTVQYAKVSGSRAYTMGWVYDSQLSKYVAALEVHDITNPASPTFSGRYTWPVAYGTYMDASGNYAYVSSQPISGSGETVTFRIIDATNPSSPTLAASSSLGYITNLRVFGSYVYAVAHSPDGQTTYLKIIDVSVPTAPVVRSSTVISNQIRNLAVEGQYLYIFNAPDSLHIFDITNPLSPTSVTDTVIGADYIYDGGVNGTRAYTLNSQGVVTAYDISNPQSISSVSTFDGSAYHFKPTYDEYEEPIDQGASRITVSGSKIYVLVGFTPTTLGGYFILDTGL